MTKNDIDLLMVVLASGLISFLVAKIGKAMWSKA